MRSSSSKKKSPLTSLQKALISVRVLHQCIYSGMSPEDAAKILSAEVKLPWTILTAIQFLTGKEAIASLIALPDNFVFEGLGKSTLLDVVARAHNVAANHNPEGSPLSSGLLVESFKRAT